MEISLLDLFVLALVNIFDANDTTLSILFYALRFLK